MSGSAIEGRWVLSHSLEAWMDPGWDHLRACLVLWAGGLLLAALMGPACWPGVLILARMPTLPWGIWLPLDTALGSTMECLGSLPGCHLGMTQWLPPSYLSSQLSKSPNKYSDINHYEKSVLHLDTCSQHTKTVRSLPVPNHTQLYTVWLQAERHTVPLLTIIPLVDQHQTWRYCQHKLTIASHWWWAFGHIC